MAQLGSAVGPGITITVSITPVLPPGTTTPTLNTSGGCNNCQVGQAPTTAAYQMAGVQGESLKDPLWYAAKYGGFDRDKTATYTVGAALPVSAWDLKSADGSIGADGVPDNYFLAIDPAQP